MKFTLKEMAQDGNGLNVGIRIEGLTSKQISAAAKIFEDTKDAIDNDGKIDILEGIAILADLRNLTK